MKMERVKINQSAINDPENKPVQRVVDAAPFAYDKFQDAYKICNIDLIQNKSLLAAQAYNYGHLFMYPMQELTGNIAYDYSGNYRDALYNSVHLNWVAPTGMIDRAARFNGSDSYIVLPKDTCSVRGLSQITFEAIIQVKGTGKKQHIYLEASEDSAAHSRFCVILNENNTLTVWTRTSDSAQSAQEVTTNTSLTEGVHMVAVTVDITEAEVLIYVDGESVLTTGTVDYGTDTAFADTEPRGNIIIGSDQSTRKIPLPNYEGIIAYLSMYSRKLNAATLLNHAQAGGII